MENDAGTDDEVERGIWRGELGRTEADLERVADEDVADVVWSKSKHNVRWNLRADLDINK